MIICTICKKEMRCVKTGQKVIFLESHVYSSDMFECHGCNASVLVTAAEGHHEDGAIQNNVGAVVMVVDV